MKSKRYQSGFTTVELLLILILVAILGLIGFYVYRSRDKKSDDTPASTAQKTETPAPDPTANWVSITSENGKFTIKHPATWVTATNPEFCSENILLLGANGTSVGKCGSEDFGQVAFVWRTDISACEDMSSELWTQNSKEAVTIAGLSGTKITATAKDPGFGIGSVSAGTPAVQYCVVANNTVYTATYTQAAGYPDSLEDFNTLVTQTWQFN